MSDDKINIRAFGYHLHWRRGEWLPYVSYNPTHRAQGWPDGYFSVYTFDILQGKQK